VIELKEGRRAAPVSIRSHESALPFVSIPDRAPHACWNMPPAFRFGPSCLLRLVVAFANLMFRPELLRFQLRNESPERSLQHLFHVSLRDRMTQ
jgi:hypothetical protein